MVVASLEPVKPLDRVFAARQALRACGVMETLREYSPAVVSTILVGLDTAGSDIDIVCCYDRAQRFVADFTAAFSGWPGYTLDTATHRQLGHFFSEGFLVEVYASSQPTRQQPAFRHFRVMERLVQHGGDPFRSRIRQLKLQGLNTEPAICHLLGIDGEPYGAVLELENWSESDMRIALDRALSNPL